MKEKIAIVACSNSGVDYIEGLDLETFRSKILIKDEEFIDNVNITAEEFYTRLREDSSLVPTTAQASTGEIVEIFEKMAEQGYTDIITITISGKMSGTYQNTVLAGTLVEEKIRVHSIDSKTTSYPQGQYTKVAYEMSNNGNTVEEIIKKVNDMISKTEVYFAVDTLKFLVKNGRISNASGFVGGLLKIKPILHIDKEGQIYSSEKNRTSKKSHDRIIQLIKSELEGKEVEKVFLIHSDAKDYIERFREEFKDFKLEEMVLSPVIGCHVGPDTIGIGYILK